MTPMKPQEVERLLNERPQVTREEIHEYERLTVHHLRANPHTPKSEEERAAHAQREHRLKELHSKLYE
jgi:hypothetical protein